MIKVVDDYFAKGCGRCERFATADCSSQRWAPGLADLRRICLEAGLVETAKWGHPCYIYAKRNIVIIGAFRDDFRLSFFNAGLMKDPNGLLERQGPNTQHPDMIRFKKVSQVKQLGSTILSYLDEAKGYAEKGIKPAATERTMELPDELIEAMDCDPELAEAFQALTPGRQRSYIFNLKSAKQPETRVSRITKFRSKIIAGKGAQER